jgi:cytosine/adenosine deaminase-related metal-dependent hydrolase
MSETASLITADVMLPIDAPPQPNAGVAIAHGLITAVGPLADLRTRFPHLPHHHYPHAALLPGLINAHTHLELSYLQNKIPPRPFADWVIALLSNLPRPEQLAEVTRSSVHRGIADSLRFGVTTIGDIAREPALVRPILRDAPLRAVSFGEIQALGPRRPELPMRLAAAADQACATARLTIGLSPHAPYTVEGPVLQQIVARAIADHLPLTIHLAELHDEGDFLAALQGDIRRVWEHVGLADKFLQSQIPLYPAGPIRWAAHFGLFPAKIPTLLAHVNYLSDADLPILAASRASVIYCPRTNHYFGHDRRAPHRWRDMQSAGINVCLGTDSLASNPDLSPLREAQFLLQRDPSLDPNHLLRMITLNPAHALGRPSDLGSLTPNKFADLAVFLLDHPTPQTAAHALLTIAPTATVVYISGKRIDPP